MKRALILALATVGAAALGYAVSVAAQSTAPTLTVYKSPTCGCCSKWIVHMRERGFVVKSLDVDDINTVKTTYGVPADAASCHTALVGGYVVEGHVPADTVKRLLREKPKVAGIAAPGMPVGSPGMEMPGGEAEHYNIVSFQKDGKTAVYEKK